MTEQETIDQLDAWRKTGALCRDKGPNGTNPFRPNTLAAYMHIQGWLERDLQLCLARAKPSYRNAQIACGNITIEGINGGYGFESHCPLIGDHLIAMQSKGDKNDHISH